MSVRTKSEKKQLPLLSHNQEHVFEQSLLALENACAHILASQLAKNKRDTERLYWQRTFKNIVTPVSLALAECKGPRQFHHHYRHNSDDSLLHPVLEPPLDVLARVIMEALKKCHHELVGIEDDAIITLRDQLEGAFNAFLHAHKTCIAT